MVDVELHIPPQHDVDCEQRIPSGTANYPSSDVWAPLGRIISSETLFGPWHDPGQSDWPSGRTSDGGEGIPHQENPGRLYEPDC